MRRLFKPYNLALYFLSIIAFFFVGVSFCGWVEAAKDQGLAGGAIVLGYGLMGSFLGLIAAVATAYLAERTIVIRLNIGLLLVIAAFFAYYTWNYQTDVKPKREQSEKEVPKKRRLKTKTISPDADSIRTLEQSVKVLNSKNEKADILNQNIDQGEPIGLGMFAPNVFDNKVLYFYGNLNLKKSIIQHLATDSIVFDKSEMADVEIISAPPWLLPSYMKLDYGILFFKVVSITQDFLEVEVNKTNSQTAHISRQAGRFVFWPEFLLAVNSVEFEERDKNSVYVKPLDHAGKMNVKYSFMKPIRIKDEWMQVRLLEDNLKEVGIGWIKWRNESRLLVQYSLLS
jgi:hypothetical protein